MAKKETFRERYKRWKKWASWNIGSPLYKIFVLLGIPNAFGVALEILGGWILGITLRMERGVYYGE